MRFLFYSSPEADHTLYNIAISYLAAYVFYLIQVYLPELKKTKTAIVQTRLDMINCLRQSKYFIEGWKEYTIGDNDKGAIIGVNKNLIYYEDYQGHIIQMTPHFLEETVGRILEEYDKIKNNFLFLQSDIELQKLFLEMDFAEQAHEWYTVLESAEMLCNNPDSTILESYSPNDVQEFESRLQKLAVVYGITEHIQLRQTKDKEKIMNYHKIIKSAYDVVEENKEYFCNLPEGYNQSVRKE